MEMKSDDDDQHRCWTFAPQRLEPRVNLIVGQVELKRLRLLLFI